MSNIDRVGGSGRMGRTARSGKAAAVKNKADTTADAGVDQLHLSSDAVLLSELQSSLESVSEIDEARVEAIRKAIKDDRLPIDYDLLAKKMLEMQDELKDL
ncbi:flagellar biosynthesis anti-sigma factor FlgM [Endozoicomonas sp. Mp262]|uniref:flagellar biosynthesis anti-sigma factor FlgM n=1 Tax=Endozoicomonas sp. Mp262 TaxID=2919499 RepID=UPI0021DA33EC